MNYMKDIATLLGVELNEEFVITKKLDNGYSSYDFYIKEDGIYNNNVKQSPYWLIEVLTGEAEIYRLPFKPKFGKTYWTLDYTPKNEIKPVEYTWNYATYDYLAYHSGLCFRTEEEALANKDKLLKIINHYKED